MIKLPSEALKHRTKRKISRIIEANNFQIKLEKELEKLKKKMKYAHKLKAIWLPNYNSKLSGEVKNDIGTLTSLETSPIICLSRLSLLYLL